MTPDHALKDVRRACAPLGLDLVQPFRVGWYDAHIDPAYRLPELGGPDRLGILVGNTRALWAPFLDALRSQPARIEAAHPLDDYVNEALDAAVRALPVRCELRTSHEPPPRRVAMQQLAHLSGLAWLAPSHLSVHPIYGPWIGLRGVIVLDVEGPAEPVPITTPCESCASRCAPAFQRAVELVADPAVAHEDIGRDWQTWLAVRDACPVGRAHRYDDAQIRYHYTKDRELLRRLVTP